MLVDTETHPPVPPELVSPVISKPKFAIFPLIIGFSVVIFVAAAIAVVYYQAKLSMAPSPSSSPSPTPSAMALASLEPSMEPSSTPTSTPIPSLKPPVISSPTPTPILRPTLDIRFGNPSASVKQTIDEGTGDGRVINREYTSIQAGQFDEVSAIWSPRVTVCYHLVSNEKVSGKDIKFSMSLDDKIVVEDNLGGYDQLEAGRIYDWCHDVTNDLGKHTAKLLLNPDKSLTENNYLNDLARLEWENLADNIAPNFTLIGPNDEGVAGTCLFPQFISDNVTPYADLKIEQKIDSADWTKFDGDKYCFIGPAGESHTYISRITDTRGNANQQNKTFVLY